MTPGSQQGLLLVPDDIAAARSELVELGAPVSEIFHGAAGRFHPENPGVRESGPDPEGRSYQTHAVFSDPTGPVGSLSRSPNDCRDGSEGARRRPPG